MASILPYLLNCFPFFIPVFVWNLIFYRKLPSGYRKPVWDNVAKPIRVLENLFRALVFILPIFLKLEFATIVQRAGAICYGVGIVVYVSSWLIVIRRPESRWSRSAVGFMAPAWTTIGWLAGIGLIGQTPTPPGIPYNFLVYAGVAVVFSAVHTARAFLVFRSQKR